MLEVYVTIERKQTVRKKSNLRQIIEDDLLVSDDDIPVPCPCDDERDIEHKDERRDDAID